MERTPLHWETAAGAAKELLQTTERTLVHELRQTARLEELLRPIFAEQSPTEKFNPALWWHILNQSLVNVAKIKKYDVDMLFVLAKDQYATLKRVLSTEKAGPDDIKSALNFCRGIDRGTRRYSTRKAFREFEKFHR